MSAAHDPKRPLKLFGGYEHIAFNNPSNPLVAGTPIIGGYVLSPFLSNTAYDNQKTLEVFWAGFKWTPVKDLDVLAAYYGYNQNNFTTAATAASCSTADPAAACSGTENVVSLVLDYRFSKRFDWYVGSMYSGVRDGLANGYLYHTNIATTTGLRFKF